MGYSDQKYYDRGESIAFVGSATYTASAANNSIASAFPLLQYPHNITLTGIKMVVQAAPKTGQTVFSYLNGTNTFATATVSSTASVGTILTASMTNTASLSTATISNTRANGQVDVSTNTITTNWAAIGSSTRATVTAAGTATASADTIGTYEIFFEGQELPPA